MLRNLWRYRSFVLGMASREFRARYLGSVLGSVWAVLHPLTLVFIYTVVPGDHPWNLAQRYLRDPAFGLRLRQILTSCAQLFPNKCRSIYA